MTLTRCPACSTVFRVTAEQLRAKAGTVRCGHCQAVFNAFAELVEETQSELPAPPDAPLASPEHDDAHSSGSPAACAGEPVASQVLPAQEVLPEGVPEAPQLDEITREIDEIAQELALATSEAPPLAVAPVESGEDATRAARAAGLVAARELSDTPAYDRWAAGTLAGSPASGFAGVAGSRRRWPWVLAALILTLALLTQLAHHFRAELVRAVPATADLFAHFAVAVPLSAQSELVSIEASDLQADNARGLFVLNAVLRNRAPYPQAWPALELTLTDASDVPLARRVMTVADYLPPGTAAASFPANLEIPVRLWVDAKEVGAAGYRLFIFYP